MAKPTALEEQLPQEVLPYAYCLAIYPSDPSYRTEVEMANDEAGTGAATVGYAERDEDVFVHFTTAGASEKWFRIRHVAEHENPSPWTPRVRVFARRFGKAVRPAPVLPTVQEQPSVSGGTTGTLTLTLIDPQKRVTQVEFQSQSGHDAVSAWTTDSTVPYSLNVSLLESLGSRISYRVTGYDAHGESMYLAEGSVDFPAKPARCSGTLRKQSDSNTSETVQLTVALGTNGATPIQYKYRVATIGATPAYSAWANVGTGASGQTVDIVVTRAQKFFSILDVVIRDGSLTEVELPSYKVGSKQDNLYDGELAAATKVQGTSGQLRVIRKGAAEIVGRHGATGTFPTGLFSAPPSWKGRGGVHHQPEAKWGTNDTTFGTTAFDTTKAVYVERELIINGNTWTIRARLVQKTTTQTERSHDVSGGFDLDTEGETVEKRMDATNFVAAAPAYDDKYYGRFKVVLNITYDTLKTIGQSSVKVALDTCPDITIGSPVWSQRATRTYSIGVDELDGNETRTWADEELSAIVAGLTSTAGIRLRVYDIVQGSNASLTVDVTPRDSFTKDFGYWTQSGSNNYASMTPDTSDSVHFDCEEAL